MYNQNQQISEQYRYVTQSNNPPFIQPTQYFPRSQFTQKPTTYVKNSSHGRFNQQNFYRKPFRNQPQSQLSEHQRGWGKRSHEQVAVTPSIPSSSVPKANETSPAPKRQLQKQNSIEIKPNKLQPKQKNTENSPANIIQTQKEREWAALFEYTLKLLEVSLPGEEVNTLLFNLQSSRSTCILLKEEIKADLLRLLIPLGVKDICVFGWCCKILFCFVVKLLGFFLGSTLTGLDFKGSDLDFHVQLISQPVTDEEVKQVIQKTGKLTRCNPDFRVIYSIQVNSFLKKSSQNISNTIFYYPECSSPNYSAGSSKDKDHLRH